MVLTSVQVLTHHLPGGSRRTCKYPSPDNRTHGPHGYKAGVLTPWAQISVGGECENTHLKLKSWEMKVTKRSKTFSCR